jgi:hypothetical protein
VLGYRIEIKKRNTFIGVSFFASITERGGPLAVEGVKIVHNVCLVSKVRLTYDFYMTFRTSRIVVFSRLDTLFTLGSEISLLCGDLQA